MTRPSELQRPFKKLFPVSSSSSTKPLSGAMCEDIWNLTETYSLLCVLPGFGDHEVDLLTSMRGRNHPDSLQEAASNLKVFLQIWLRLSSATLFSLRAWSLFVCTKAMEDAEPGTLDRVNRAIKQCRDNYKADITVAMQLMEIHFPKSCLSSNAHSAVCRAVHEISMMGAILPELGIERLVS
jgi:hypothetical protein